MPYCENCGASVSPDEKFCHACGTKMPITSQPPIQTSPQPQIQTAPPQVPILPQSDESDEYRSATAKTVDDARQLIEAGFEYVCDFNGTKLFRKSK